MSFLAPMSNWKKQPKGFVMQHKARIEKLRRQKNAVSSTLNGVLTGQFNIVSVAVGLGVNKNNQPDYAITIQTTQALNHLDQTKVLLRAQALLRIYAPQDCKPKIVFTPTATTR